MFSFSGVYLSLCVYDNLCFRALWEQVKQLRSYVSALVGGGKSSDTLMSAVSPMLPRGGPMSSFSGTGPVMGNVVPRFSNGSVDAPFMKYDPSHPREQDYLEP